MSAIGFVHLQDRLSGCAAAMIFDAREGVTMMPPASGLNHAVTVAAGDAAAALANLRSPPIDQAVFYESEKAWNSVVSSPKGL
jgi:hypothetical protein